jgi:hypothetical protein
VDPCDGLGAGCCCIQNYNQSSNHNARNINKNKSCPSSDTPFVAPERPLPSPPPYIDAPGSSSQQKPGHCVLHVLYISVCLRLPLSTNIFQLLATIKLSVNMVVTHPHAPAITVVMAQRAAVAAESGLSNEIIKTIREVVQLNPLFQENVQYFQRTCGLRWSVSIGRLCPHYLFGEEFRRLAGALGRKGHQTETAQGAGLVDGTSFKSESFVVLQTCSLASEPRRRGVESF